MLCFQNLREQLDTFYSKCYIILMNKTQVIHSTTNGHFGRIKFVAII